MSFSMRRNEAELLRLSRLCDTLTLRKEQWAERKGAAMANVKLQQIIEK